MLRNQIFSPFEERAGRSWSSAIRRQTAALFLCSLAAFFSSGCFTAQNEAPLSSPGEIVQLSVITMPVALNMDDRPGVDGFSLKVYANDATHPKTVPIREGTVEVIVWDGTLFGKTNPPPPLRIWTFQAAELKPFEFLAGIGTGYELSLAWGAAAPERGIITAAARYTAPNGRIVRSQPSSVSVVDQ